MFPIGHLTKHQVRALAKKYGLPNARRKDSQGLCFLGDVTLVDVLKKELNPTQGAVVDEKGAVIGSHQGAALYTLGQRYGFTLFAHAPNTKPHYVISKDIAKNILVVSTSALPTAYTATNLELEEVNWIGDSTKSDCQARFRYRQTLIPALLDSKNGIARVCLKKPFYIPEGQSLVLYQGARCLGGGVIAHTILV
jgi:tRNA-specific 2-thiouridylase